jgi:NAD+ dependent glucose-6-phosphate dehydrogenase
MRVIITGAAGRIGSQLVEELSRSHELGLIDVRPVNGRKSIIADLSVAPRGWRSWLKPGSGRWREAFTRAQVVVHLAADIDPQAPWESVLPNNIQATWNVIQAAAKHGVPRVVFASSNWAVKALEQKLAPDCYRVDGAKIDSETAPFPITAYGLSKGFGELAGRMFVDEGKLESFVAVRIGNYNPTPSTDDIVRARWIGVEDLRSLLRRCVEVDIKGFHVVYGVSTEETSPYDLSHTRTLLSWSPQRVSDNPSTRPRFQPGLSG